MLCSLNLEISPLQEIKLRASSVSFFSTKFVPFSSILAINQLANYLNSLRALSKATIKSTRTLSRNNNNTIINRLNHLNKHMATSSTFDRTLFLADKSPPVCSLEIKAPFNELTEKESKYNH